MIPSISTNNSFSVLNNGAFAPTPGEIRVFLIEKGVLPTLEEAQATFWSLGDNWWRQIIDGKHQKYGSMVFDKGLHGGHIEPGYLKGVENACHYFVDNMDKGFSIELYKWTHHVACAHFSQNEGNGIVCGRYEIDLFRTAYEKASSAQVGAADFEALGEKLNLIRDVKYKLDSAIEAFERTDEEELKRAEFYKKHFGMDAVIKDAETKRKELDEAIDKCKNLFPEQFGEVCVENDPGKISKILRTKEIETIDSLKKIGKEHVQGLNEHFKQVAKRLGLQAPFIECFFQSDRTVSIEYEKSDSSLNFEEITKKLISEFNLNLENLQKIAYEKIQTGASTKDVKREYQESVIPLIAQLYAELEWAHPWIDGQGRTDLIMLNGLLCLEGLNPCILWEPYFSTSNGILDWINYLKIGINSFESLKARC